MSEAVAYCGLICETCPVYLATREKNKSKQDRMRAKIVRICKEQYGMEYDLKDINDCDGCRTEEGRMFLACKNCHIRNCAKRKGFESCAYCSEYVCGKLEEFFVSDPSAKTRLDKIKNSLI